MYYYCFTLACKAVNEMRTKPQGERDKDVIGKGSMARQQLIEGLKSFDSVYGESEYFLSDKLTFIDCTAIPLWMNLDKAAISLQELGLNNIINHIRRESEKSYFKAVYSPAKSGSKEKRANA